MQKIFSGQLCRSCDQNYLLEQQKQEQIASASASRFSQTSSQNDNPSLLASSDITQNTSSFRHLLAHQKKKPLHQPLQINRPLSKVSCRKGAHKENKIQKNRPIQLGTCQASLGIKSQLEAKQSVRPLVQKRQYLSSCWQSSGHAYQPYLGGYLDSWKCEGNNQFRINFGYKVEQKGHPGVIFLKQGQEKALTESCEKQQIDLKEEDKNIKHVRFSCQQDINVYTQKTITEYSQISHSSHSQEPQYKSFGLSPQLQERTSSLTNSQLEVVQEDWARIQSLAKRENLVRPRKEKKVMTAFVSQPEAPKDGFRTVQTIKSIDNGSEGSIIDSTFMRTLAQVKQLRNLL